jgi:four helix bundle protein
MTGRLASSFTDLEVYQRARRLAGTLFERTKSFPREETYALTDQLRRSSRAIGAQIAEAWGKRLYPRHFLSKLTDADAEQRETRHWIAVATDCGYLDSQEAADFLEDLGVIGRCWAR